jgi:hypothetical protein
MIKNKLNINEQQYLHKMNFIYDNYNIISNPKEKDWLILECTEDQADEIRDKCSEKLQLDGFDEKYELTAEGKILEDLEEQELLKK